MKLETITREELELERIDVKNKQNVLCRYDNDCSRSGEFLRCYLDNFVLCPFYKTYYAQEKGK